MVFFPGPSLRSPQRTPKEPRVTPRLRGFFMSAASGPGLRLPREAKARAAEGEAGDPLTPESVVQSGLKVAKKKRQACGTAFPNNYLTGSSKKEDRMISSSSDGSCMAQGLASCQMLTRT